MAEQNNPSKNYLFRWVEGFLLAAHTATNPSHAEWGAMTTYVKSLRPDQLKGTLVYTEGGSPNALQRKQLRDAFLQGRGVSPPSAVLTNSALARTAITALNLFLGGKVRAFAPEDIEEALLFLEAPRDKWLLLKKNLEELKRELGIHSQSNSWL